MTNTHDVPRGVAVAIGVAIGLLVLLGIQAEAAWTDPGHRTRIALGLASAVVVATLAGVAVAARRPVLAAGLVVAITPAAFHMLPIVSTAAAVAAVAVGPLWRRRGGAVALVPVAAVAALASTAWWRATPVRDEGTAPSIGDLAASTGEIVRRALATVGSDHAPVPATAELAWWVAVGVVVAAVAVSQHRIVAVVPALCLATMIAATFTLERWRGPADPSGGAWLVAGGIAFAASRVELTRMHGRRVGATALALSAWALTMTTAAAVRFASVDEVGVPPWERWRSWSGRDGSIDARWLLPAAALGGLAIVSAAAVLARTTRDRGGVNVLGYHTITAGLGDRARELTGALEAAGVPVARVDLEVDSERESERLPDPAVRYASSIVVAPAFEVASIAARHPWAFAERRIVAGYWFWELADVPESHHRGLEVVDEVWAPSRFVADAYRPVTPKPVRLVPLPVAEPAVAPIGRSELGFGEGEIVFVTSFSHLSVMERKNPFGVIEAFRRAFPADGPTAPSCRLVVKSLNADRRPHDARRLAEAAAGDDRIQIRTDRVEHAELMALIAAADVLVSLHRSEGLGLHLAEAMWVGTPIIATDHSGSRDLLDRHCAELVPWRPTGVVNGDGAYPDGATWADPDLDAAAAAMRRLAADPERRARLATIARDRIARQPDSRSAGRLLAKLARCPVPR